jgi:hypothetical protein
LASDPQERDGQANKGFQYPHGHLWAEGGSETRSAEASRSSAAGA